MRYPHILRAVTETPWAMRPDRLAVVLDIVAARAAGERFTAEEIQARVGGQPGRRGNVAAGSVAVIPLSGVLVPKASMFTQVSGATSVQMFGDAVTAAAADESVDAILIDIDSPGGMTDLVPEVAAQVRAARAVKPVVAIANTDAASAAYWIGSQASEFVVTPSGMVGSIGVFAAHEDMSARLEKDGVRTTLISAGRYKVESNPYEPLSDEARAAIQGRVDTFYDMFVADVAAGRGVTLDAVRGGFGEGRTVTSGAALALGMVDRVATFDDTLARLATGAAARRASQTATSGDPPLHTVVTIFPPEAAVSGLSFADEASALRDSAERLVDRTNSLREVERGHLTVAKREHLTACTGALRQSAEALDGLLAATEPHTSPDPDVLREAARHEHGRTRT